MRKSYLRPEEAFTEDQLVAKEPIAQFDEWFAVATLNPVSKHILYIYLKIFNLNSKGIFLNF